MYCSSLGVSHSPWNKIQGPLLPWHNFDTYSRAAFSPHWISNGSSVTPSAGVRSLLTSKRSGSPLVFAGAASLGSIFTLKLEGSECVKVMWADAVAAEFEFWLCGGIFTEGPQLELSSWESSRLYPEPRFCCSVVSSLTCGKPVSSEAACSTGSLADMLTFSRPEKLQIQGEVNCKTYAKSLGNYHVRKSCAAFLFSRGDTGDQPNAVCRRQACRYLFDVIPCWHPSRLIG